MPQRIQLRRVAGWRKPEGAIVVARPSKWGNPFAAVLEDDMWHSVRRGVPVSAGYYGLHFEQVEAVDYVVTLYRRWLDKSWIISNTWDLRERREAILSGLPSIAGHDLACWCPLDQPCHADVLLEIANGGER